MSRCGPLTIVHISCYDQHRRSASTSAPSAWRRRTHYEPVRRRRRPLSSHDLFFLRQGAAAVATPAMRVLRHWCVAAHRRCASTRPSSALVHLGAHPWGLIRAFVTTPGGSLPIRDSACLFHAPSGTLGLVLPARSATPAAANCLSP